MRSKQARRERKERQKQKKYDYQGYKVTYADPTPEEALNNRLIGCSWNFNKLLKQRERPIFENGIIRTAADYEEEKKWGNEK